MKRSELKKVIKTMLVEESLYSEMTPAEKIRDWCDDEYIGDKAWVMADDILQSHQLYRKMNELDSVPSSILAEVVEMLEKTDVF
jgi:hypothetical protein